MKRLKSILVALSVLFLASCNGSNRNLNEPLDYTQWVDPYIGTDYHGHVFLGASVPFGAVQVGPTNYTRGWDWCSGYHYSDSVLLGFSHMHLSGTGIGDLGDVLITPYTGEIDPGFGAPDEFLKSTSSKYSHEDEIVRAGYYAVQLNDYNIFAEITASRRAAYHRYTFQGNETPHIALNLHQGIGWDRPVDTYIKLENDTTISGYRFSTGWAKNQRLYFAVRLSYPVSEIEFLGDDSVHTDIEARGTGVIAMLNFQPGFQQPLLIKVGISGVSAENALANIDAEIGTQNFDETRKNAIQAWNSELGKITIKTDNEKELRSFYTAMYHAFMAPALFNDYNQEYRGADGETHVDPGFDNYSIFSLWDTYRALHPLFTVIQSGKVDDMVSSMLSIYNQQGKLPVWHLVGNETDCMVGYSSVPVLADAFLKGLIQTDPEILLQAMKASAMRDEQGLTYLKQLGYIPADKEKESVSKALEYALADGCIARVAKEMGHMDDYQYFSERALYYMKYFDKQSGFMRAKLSDGSFRTPFDAFKSTHEWGDYTEGNAWQYTWLVPHDVEGLISLFGGEEAFTQKLDSLFLVEGYMGDQASPDISGLIGQYAQGNEPGHHIPYLYAYAGEQWKTARKINKITTEFYHDRPSGLCGNEDCGQMSAWYILSTLGIYQVNPAGGVFVFGSPLFEEVSLQLPGEKQFEIRAKNLSKDNIYIQSASINGIAINRSFITYQEIMKGGILEFSMGAQPNKNFGYPLADRPKSIWDEF